MFKLMIVEDDRQIEEAVMAHAALWGMEAKGIEDFSQVEKEVMDFAPHILLLDIKLPFFDGYHWCSRIRRFSKLPILFISSASDTMNMVMAMNMGGDDFISKPFNMDVLMAKLQAMLRRAYDFSEPIPLLTHKEATLHPKEQSIEYHGKSLPLSRNEYRMLLCLFECKGQVVSREKLMEKLWETDSFVDENTLTVNVNRLRKKLEGIDLKGFITTRFGSGYLLE